VRCAYRVDLYNDPDDRFDYNGFRVVRVSPSAVRRPPNRVRMPTLTPRGFTP